MSVGVILLKLYKNMQNQKKDLILREIYSIIGISC